MPPDANQIFFHTLESHFPCGSGGGVPSQQRRQTPESLVIKCDGWQEQVLSKPGLLPNEVLPSRFGTEMPDSRTSGFAPLASNFLQEWPGKSILLPVCVCVITYSNTVLWLRVQDLANRWNVAHGAS